MYNYFKEHNMLVLTGNDEVYLSKSTTFNFGMMDLTNPEVIEYLKETIIKKNMIDIGIDGWMADFGEYLPVDCKLYNGNPRLLHNEWPTLWAKANREAVDEHPRGKDIVFFLHLMNHKNTQHLCGMAINILISQRTMEWVVLFQQHLILVFRVFH